MSSPCVKSAIVVNLFNPIEINCTDMDDVDKAVDMGDIGEVVDNDDIGEAVEMDDIGDAELTDDDCVERLWCNRDTEIYPCMRVVGCWSQE